MATISNIYNLNKTQLELDFVNIDTEKDIKTLIDKGFAYLFDSGPLAIRHWLANNQIRNDRYHETYFKNEKNMIGVNLNNKTYYLYNEEGLPDGLPLVALDEIRRKRIMKKRKKKKSLIQNNKKKRNIALLMFLTLIQK